MKGKFVEDEDLRLAVQLEPESDDERLLLRAFSAQAEACQNRLIVSGWGMGGEKTGLRHLRLFVDVRSAKNPVTS